MYIGKIIKDKETEQLWQVTSIAVTGEAALKGHSYFYIRIVLELIKSYGPIIWDTRIIRNTFVPHDKATEEEFFKKLFAVPFPIQVSSGDTQTETPD